LLDSAGIIIVAYVLAYSLFNIGRHIQSPACDMGERLKAGGTGARFVGSSAYRSTKRMYTWVLVGL